VGCREKEAARLSLEGAAMKRLWLWSFGLAACTSVPERVVPAAPEEADTVDGGGAPAVDRIAPVRGVPNRGRDPAVVVVEGEATCAGVLVSPRLVLTARHCVAGGQPCPTPAMPSTEARVLVGEDLRTARTVARSVEIVGPDGEELCGADLAFVVLDTPITTLKPLALRARGPAVGERLRAVGYGPRDDLQRIVREHVAVTDVHETELAVAEAACLDEAGGPLLDEDTGEVVGVLSRPGPRCEGPGVHNVYTRVDAFASLVEAAFARIEALELEARRDAGSTAAARPAKRGTKQRPASDVGSDCEGGAGCAAGICVRDAVGRYCSRPCGPGDRCPTRYRCTAFARAESTCLLAR